MIQTGVLIPNEIRFLPFSFSFSTNLVGIFTCEELDNPFFLSPMFWPSDSLLPLQDQHWHQSFRLFAKLAYPNIIFNVSKDTRNFQTFSSTILVISPKLSFQSCYFFAETSVDWPGYQKFWLKLLKITFQLSNIFVNISQNRNKLIQAA